MSGWIPITMRPMTAEEIEHHVILNCMDDGMILTCPIPEDGQEVLITIDGEVLMDTFCQGIEGCYFDTYEIECISAWMPLPEPYKAENEDEG